MTHSPSKDLCQRPTLIASSEKHTKLVHDSTANLHRPIQSILSTLNDRAIALSNCVNYNAALHDAKVMQQLSPATALGYIREATVYSAQGKQHQVIDICTKGLDMINAHDADYALLQQFKMDAEQRQKTHIDIICQLPLDIVISTLVPMFIDDRCMDVLKLAPSLHVSRSWRDRIIQSLGGLRFHIESEDNTKLPNLILFSRYIKSLHIDTYSKGTWLGDLLSDNDFSSLREIQIEGFLTIHVGHFLASLKSVGRTLTHFNVDMEGGPMLGVPEVVLACPNLVSLRICESYDPNVSSLPMSHWSSLTSLCLTFSHKPITCDHVIEIWKRFPSLMKLELHPCTNIQSALAVSEYRPSMKSLRLDMWGLGIHFIYSDEGIHSEEVGITKLIIGTEEFDEDVCKNTSSVVKRYHHTLKHLQWDMDISQDTENIDTILFPCLTKLHLISCGWQIPRNAPVLEELTLTETIINMHPQVLDVDMVPPYLKSLELDLITLNDDDGDSTILCYLNSIALQCQLKELVLRFNSLGHVASILDAIYRHDQLECLKISFTAQWESYPMANFAEGLVKACTCLSCLELKCRDAPSTYSINTLKQLPQLNNMAFSVYRTSDIDSFWNAINTFTKLKCITVYASPTAEDARINQLKQQRPDMKIIIDKQAIDF